MIATRPFKAGDLMYKGYATLVAGVTEYDLHLTHSDGTVEITRCSTVNSVMDTEDLEDAKRQFYGFDGFMNHSCDANCFCPATGKDGDRLLYDAFAIKDIEVGDEITADYATFDYECDGHEIEVCGCISANCRGSMRGFKNLSLEEQVGSPIIHQFEN
jgi:hypothetical protein